MTIFSNSFFSFSFFLSFVSSIFRFSLLKVARTISNWFFASGRSSIYLHPYLKLPFRMRPRVYPFFSFHGLSSMKNTFNLCLEKLPRSSREVLICPDRPSTVSRKILWNNVDHDPFIFSAWTISTKCHLNSFHLPPAPCSIYVAVYFKCLSHERRDQRLSIFGAAEQGQEKARSTDKWLMDTWNGFPMFQWIPVHFTFQW